MRQASRPGSNRQSRAAPLGPLAIRRTTPPRDAEPKSACIRKRPRAWPDAAEGAHPPESRAIIRDVSVNSVGAGSSTSPEECIYRGIGSASLAGLVAPIRWRRSSTPTPCGQSGSVPTQGCSHRVTPEIRGYRPTTNPGHPTRDPATRSDMPAGRGSGPPRGAALVRQARHLRTVPPNVRIRCRRDQATRIPKKDAAIGSGLLFISNCLTLLGNIIHRATQHFHAASRVPFVTRRVLA